jgi:hypothetical protein
MSFFAFVEKPANLIDWLSEAFQFQHTTGLVVLLSFSPVKFSETSCDFKQQVMTPVDTGH